MLGLIAAAGVGKAFHVGLLLTAFGFGFRHGIDWDHIAALTDITSSQDQSRRSMFFATMYALGHGLVVFVLGFTAIVLAARLPASVDRVMERVVGGTLILLAVYVFYGLATKRRDFRMRSRWMLLFSGARRAYRSAYANIRERDTVEITHEHFHALDEIHELDHEHNHDRVLVSVGSDGTIGAQEHHRHSHSHKGHLPSDPFADYAPHTAFGIGMLHGIGAETPTQVLIFVTAAGAGGKAVGLLLLVSFLVGLLFSNTVIAAAGTLGFLGVGRHFALYVTVSVLTAAFSLVTGTLFLFGSAPLLPAIFGG